MKKLFFLMVICSCVFTASINAQQTDVSSTGTMDPKAAAYYNKAIQSMKAEQFEDALKSLDSSLTISKDYRIYYLQGQANLKLGKINDATQSFSECVKLNPDYDLGWMAAGNAHLSSKEYDQAINDFKKVAEVTKDPNVKSKAEESVKFTMNAISVDYYNKGNELNKGGKFEEAIKSYDQALAISKNPKYYYQKGLALSKLNKNKEAEQELKSAVALNDSFDIGYVALGNLQNINKDYTEAIKSYEKALAVTKNETLKTSIKETILKTYLAAGSNSYNDKKYDQSIEWMLKSISISPSDAAYLSLAKSYIEKKKYSEAITALDSSKSLQKTVTDGAIAYYRGLIHLNKGADNKAIESFTVALNDPTYKKASQTQIDYLNAKLKGTKPKK
jgi:tetratricopeptide (TPR) repeat protein